jgi:hypothetical protein
MIEFKQNLNQQEIKTEKETEIEKRREKPNWTYLAEQPSRSPSAPAHLAPIPLRPKYLRRSSSSSP